MYGILSTKTLYTFFKRHPDIASGIVSISRTFDATQEAMGPVLLYTAAMAAEQPPPSATELPQTLPKKAGVSSQQLKPVAAEADLGAAAHSNGNTPSLEQQPGCTLATPDEGSSK